MPCDFLRFQRVAPAPKASKPSIAEGSGTGVEAVCTVKFVSPKRTLYSDVWLAVSSADPSASAEKFLGLKL